LGEVRRLNGRSGASREAQKGEKGKKESQGGTFVVDWGRRVTKRGLERRQSIENFESRSGAGKCQEIGGKNADMEG